jgi:putative transposase
VLGAMVQKRHDTEAALKLMRRLLKNQACVSVLIVTDGLVPHGSALRRLGIVHRHRVGGLRQNTRAENSHLVIRRRERRQQRFKSLASAQCFLSTHAAIDNCLAHQPQPISRSGLWILRAEAHRSWAVSAA